MLLMKKAFFEAIRSGRKTVTLRCWRHQRVAPGQVHTVPGLGKVRIESVEAVRLSSVTDADAAADGFRSVAELRKALKKMYPSLRRAGGRGQVYAVRFTFLDKTAPKAKSRRPKSP
ncbi:MAG: hypothetical protein AMK72_04665 [Planctomycetes bacterium SM23_25]|nr:MAG: hypothetical protein AMK72_04665 [Planctomycetes bacterium SM23_25]